MDEHNAKLKPFSFFSTELPFLRSIYRTLFSRRKAYAAFDRGQILNLLKKLNPTSTVLDPMSGYGVLAEVCRPLGISTHSIELNPPSYLWQVFLSPDSKEGIVTAIRALEKSHTRIKLQKEFEVSDTWFPNQSAHILQKMWERALPEVEKSYSKEKAEDMLAAVLLPFLGRLAAYSEGTINIQVKKGGIVFYKNWTLDLKNYLRIIQDVIFNDAQCTNSNHEITFGNSLCSLEMRNKFSYIVTSPPYPNMRDYYAFFFPENYALENIFRIKRFTEFSIRENIIGSAMVSEFKKKNEVNFETLTSECAKKFLNDLKSWKGAKKSIDDNISYYIPYYYSYFLSLEKAYTNIHKLLTPKVDGYIVVVNNTARKFTIPVNTFIKEIWGHFGCTSAEELATERAHVGSINPRVVGFKARHTEYAIRITRNDA